MHEPYLPYVPQALQNIWVHVLLGTRGWIQAKGVGEGSGEIRALLAEYREVLQTADVYSLLQESSRSLHDGLEQSSRSLAVVYTRWNFKGQKTRKRLRSMEQMQLQLRFPMF